MHEAALHLVTLGFAVEHAAHGFAVMREIGVQANEASIACLVDAGDRVPGRWRRLAFNAQVPLTAAFDHGVPHVDRDLLVLSAAQSPDMGCGKAGGGNAGLR